MGNLRYLIGDYTYVPLDPPVPGQGEYAAFSDAELEALLAMSNGNASRAVGYAYLKLAGAAAGEAVSWATDDLRLSLEKTPAELRAVAQMWFSQADDEDNDSGAGEYFDLVQFGQANRNWWELAERPW